MIIFIFLPRNMVAKTTNIEMHTIQYEKNNLTRQYFKHTIRPTKMRKTGQTD